MPVRQVSGDPRASTLTAAPPAGPLGDDRNDGVRPDTCVDDLLRPQVERSFERPGRHIDGTHPRSTAAGDLDRRQSDAAAAQDDDGLARANRRPPDHRPIGRGDAAAEPGGRPDIEPVRKLDEVGGRGMDDDELGERPGVGEAGLALVRADLPCAGAADVAPAACHDERRRHPAAHPGAVHPLPDGLDDPRQLVARDVGEGGDVRVVTEPPVPVTAAQATGAHAHDGPAGRGSWFRDLDHVEGGPEGGIREGSHGTQRATVAPGPERRGDMPPCPDQRPTGSRFRHDLDIHWTVRSVL